MQDRKHRTIACGIQVFHALPRSREWTGFRFAISNCGGDYQIGIIESSAKCVREHISELAAFVDRSRCWHTHVARYAARCRKAAKQLAHATDVLTYFRIYF